MITIIFIIILSIFIFVTKQNNKLKQNKLKQNKKKCGSIKLNNKLNNKLNKCNIPTILVNDKIHLSLNQIQNLTYPVYDYKWGGCQANKPTKSSKFTYI
tara:strand:- start:2174 stop:2470 length:297 start_codon:yes stop_codon:yes gene_type:complete